jgi:hypothetical protein
MYDTNLAITATRQRIFIESSFSPVRSLPMLRAATETGPADLDSDSDVCSRLNLALCPGLITLDSNVVDCGWCRLTRLNWFVANCQTGPTDGVVDLASRYDAFLNLTCSKSSNHPIERVCEGVVIVAFSTQIICCGIVSTVSSQP